MIIFFEFLGYLLVRQIVNIIEFCSACKRHPLLPSTLPQKLIDSNDSKKTGRGERGKLRKALRKAENFEEVRSSHFSHTLPNLAHNHYSLLVESRSSSTRRSPRSLKLEEISPKRLLRRTISSTSVENSPRTTSRETRRRRSLCSVACSVEE